MQRNQLELYIHIPFCARKCDYCDFLSAPAGREVQRRYMEALKREIRQFAQIHAERYEVSSVFFGGGTPSLLPAADIAEVTALLKQKFLFLQDAEVSLECNPGTADEQKLSTYLEAGINRLSFGLQSANREELQLLGRIHTWEDFAQLYASARRVGFSNINVDLMSALPGQTVDSWKETLRRVLALEPALEHISAYSLIIEEGTPFHERYALDAKRRDEGEQPERLPSEEAEREMYRLTEEILQQAGMHRYEISNYAKEGYECRHNIGYWDGTEYAGFGLGASSMLRLSGQTQTYVRVQNGTELDDYTGRIVFWPSDPMHCTGLDTAQNLEILTIQDRMEEFMFLGLRMMAGISEAVFAQRFGKTVDEVYGAVLKRQQELGLLERREGRIALTKRGIDVSNAVMAEFLL